MPATYFISPFCPPVWEGETSIYIEPREYAKALELNWRAEVTIKSLPSNAFTLNWDMFENNNIILSGWLHPDNKVVSISGTSQSMAAFAIWHRDLVSKNEPLYIFDEGLHTKFEINDRTQVDDVVEAIDS
jgi:hypothetical protein